MSTLHQHSNVPLQNQLLSIAIVAALVLVGLVWLYLGWRKCKKAEKADTAQASCADDEET